MNFIDIIKEKAKSNIKTIILPESMDKRVLDAAIKIVDEKIANIIVIGDSEKIKELCPDFDTNKIRVINPCKCDFIDKLSSSLFELRKDKGLSYDEAKQLLLSDYMYFACMLVKTGMADGVVSGACHSTANTLRPALQIIKTKKEADLISSFFLMCVPNCEYGYNGTFVFADCGLVQNPTSSELASIAKDSADSFRKLTGENSMVALISHSTKGSAKHADVDKVVEALNIAKDKYPKYMIDGELQIDAAIVPEVAAIKAKGSLVAGHANVLVFPDLDAGNSGYKLVQRLAKALAYGPICQGIAAPVNDLSRGCSVDDIVGVVAITAVQAQDN